MDPFFLAGSATERAVSPRVPPRKEEASFERVYEEQVDFVWRSALRLGVDESEAEDAVQKVFLVVYRRLGDFEGRSSLKSWLFSILLRVVREHRRHQRRKSPHLSHEPVDPDLVADSAVDPHEALSRAEASRTIGQLLDSLKGDKRVVFIMAELEEMTALEISEATGIHVKAVYSRLRAARTDFERAAAALRRRRPGSGP